VHILAFSVKLGRMAFFLKKRGKVRNQRYKYLVPLMLHKGFCFIKVQQVIVHHPLQMDLEFIILFKVIIYLSIIILDLKYKKIEFLIKI
jgi:hypothetical protein